MKEQGLIRLADKIRAGMPLLSIHTDAQGNSDYTEDNQTGKIIRGLMQEATVVDYSNIAEYFFDHYGDKPISLLDLESCVPPFPVSFWETPTPQSYKDKNPPPYVHRSGCAVLAFPPAPWREAKNFMLQSVMLTGKTYDPNVLEQFFQDEDGNPVVIAPETKCRMVMGFFIQKYREAKGAIILGTFTLLTNEIGKPIARMVCNGVGDIRRAIGEKKFEDVISCEVWPMLVAVQFCHCKNVTIEEQKPCDRLSKRFQHDHGFPLVRYRTLSIEPVKRILTTEGQIESNGIKRALHLCRGHFAHYTPERPLFGKVTGTFWVPAHVRGSLESGAVVKDYKVKA